MKRSIDLLLGAAAVLALESCGGSPPLQTPIAPSLPLIAVECGVERWAVKTLTDVDAVRVDPLRVTPTTISALNTLAAHCSGLPDGRTFDEEFRVYEVVGIVQLARNETDHDVHLALADPNDVTKTMVVEVVDPACATASTFMTIFANTRLQYESLGSLGGRPVRVRGVGFYDFAHGQTGRSQSCIELHPVLSISTP